ncbi:DUF2061 domain-containing protein [Stakelama pacifica]|uniref:Putative membrane protein DUF2061 n=1 Tax=Stakelama pacifica TaxID=517720 RepID=A0A4R6FL97_9SPHN|nr:DUF2061 domain-containing protein [Stakelama pacifica]TDN81690.1 putative membrane protein DUF2061 [Stakelama pacifica]GGO96273.1 hypothetical protein GCM10011329_22410 [Stakelama pacifica]
MLLLRGTESHPRSILKAISWRTLGSLDTFVLSWLFSGNPTIAVSIAGTEVFTKIFLFYLHERGWAMVRWGIKPLPRDSASEDRDRPAEGAAPAAGK